MKQQIDRKGFEEAISNMAASSSPYFQEYVFYLHILSQCRVHFDTTLEAAAAVSFTHNHYNLYINPLPVIAEVTKDDGTVDKVLGFHTGMPLAHRIGILKHEMLHILLNHVGPDSRHLRETYELHEVVNCAMDCALDQLITREHLPDYAQYPDTFSKAFGINPQVPDNCTWEQYYNLVPQEKKDQIKKNQEDFDKMIDSIVEQLQKQQAKGGTGPAKCKGNYTGSHRRWEESVGDSVIQKAVAKKMAEKAANNTTKSRGNLPSNYSDMLEILSDSREVNWKTILRSTLGNKRVGVLKTIRRPSRRLQNTDGVKGKIKDRVMDLLVVSDVSGSVSDQATMKMWSEITNLCRVMSTDVNLIQVDTEPTKPEKIDRKTKVIERKACGGTFLSPAITKAKQHKINFNAIIVTTDGYLSENDVEEFYKTGLKVIWLIQPEGQIMDGMNQGNMIAIKLKE